MAIHIKIHKEDEAELLRIRRELLGWRHVTGITQKQMAIKARHSEKWASELEQGLVHPHLSSLQDWAAVFDLRVQPNLVLPDFAGVEVPPLIDQNLHFTWRMSKPFHAAEWVRHWCMAELVWERYWRGITGAEMSRRMGLTPSAVPGWERDGNDPLISKIFVYARQLGGYIQFQLLERKEWSEKTGSRCGLVKV